MKFYKENKCPKCDSLADFRWDSLFGAMLRTCKMCDHMWYEEALDNESIETKSSEGYIGGNEGGAGGGGGSYGNSGMAPAGYEQLPSGKWVQVYKNTSRTIIQISNNP